MDFDFTSIDWKTMIVDYGTSILKFVAVILIGFWVVGMIMKLVERSLSKSDVDASLRSFLKSIVGTLLKVLVIITALSQLGVEMTSFVAILGAAGLAVGMALSGTLQNFAGGVLLLLLKPFKVGDIIQAQGHTGKVTDIQVFMTTLTTPDNKIILLPNGPLANNDVVNFSTLPIRRVDIPMGIGYGDDIEAARKVLLKVLTDHPMVLQSPAPTVVVTAHGESSVDLSVRPYCNSSDYLAVYSSVLENGKYALDAAGIDIPYPQRVVHNAPAS